jgi:hypothetical protein
MRLYHTATRLKLWQHRRSQSPFTATDKDILPPGLLVQKRLWRGLAIHWLKWSCFRTATRLTNGSLRRAKNVRGKIALWCLFHDCAQSCHFIGNSAPEWSVSEFENIAVYRVSSTFDTELFVTEDGASSGIWDSRSRSYSDRSEHTSQERDWGKPWILQ